MSRVRYLVWDWNGTLLDDTFACCAAVNEMLSVRQLPAIDLDFFRSRFAFPSRRFYDEIGMTTCDATWDAMAQEYHDRYHRQPVRINPDAVPAFEAAKANGFRQSILSALRQDFLDLDTRNYGVASYMDHVFGGDNLDGGSKEKRAHELYARLVSDGVGPGEAVMIGDSLHDKEVADAIGIGCVLFSGGTHSAERLRAVAPTADTLAEAVLLAASL